MTLGQEIALEPKLSDLLDQALRHRRVLSDFMGEDSQVMIEGQRSALEVEISLSPRIELVGGEIEIHHDRSSAPAQAGTRLRLSWDEQTIAAESLIGEEGADERIGGRFTASPDGLNNHKVKLGFEPVSGPAEPGHEPWTQIDATRSWIALEYRLRPIDPLLDELRDLMDERLWAEAGLTIVTPPLYAVTESHYEWGSRIAQRAALWFGVRPLEIDHADALEAGRDQIVVGTRADLIGLLPQTISDQISSSFVGVYPHPEDQRHFLLVLSGADVEGVDRAVRAFAYSPEQLPSLARVDVTGWEETSRDPLSISERHSPRQILPDLELWAAGRIACDFWVTARESGSLAAAWTVAGRLAQSSGDMATTLRVTNRRPDRARHWFAIGPRAGLDAEITTASPLDQVALEESDGMLAQFASPTQPGVAGGILTAADSLLLRERALDLIQPAVWDDLRGDTATWQLGADGANYQRLAATFESGEIGWFTATCRVLSAVPWMSLIICLAGIIAIFWLVRKPMTSGRDWDVVPVRKNANRRVSRSRRKREVARREARLVEARHHAHASPT